MNYPAVSIPDAATELNRLHGEIEQKLRTTVQDAIRAGEILAQVKDRLEHGEFLPWIKQNCEFGTTTADKYRKLYIYRDKIPSSGNLQDAYRDSAQIESREKKAENQKARERVKHYRKTGEKLEGWRRGTEDKLALEDKERDERIDAARERSEEVERKRESERRRRDEERESFRQTDEILQQAVEQMGDAHQKRQEFKERIRLSQSGGSDAFVDAIMDYLDELEDDNRRIEACQNIIKVCRNVATQLQRET